MTDSMVPDDVLADCDLEPIGGRGVPGPSVGPAGRVRCGRPLLYPVPSPDLPPMLRRAARPDRRYVGALFAFDLDALPAGQRYTGARFEVMLAGSDVRAVHLAADGDELGLVQESESAEPASAMAAQTVAAARSRAGWLRRLAPRRNLPRTWTTGLHSGSIGWVHDDPRGAYLLPRSYGMHALLEAPAGLTDLDGILAVQVEVAGAGPKAVEYSASTRFCEQVTAAGAPTGFAVRLCVAADVVGYSRRGNLATEALQRELVEVLTRARRAAGIPDDQVIPQPQGDGQFTVLPVGIDESAVIPRLIATIGEGLAARDPGDEPMRLRVALHRGLVKEAANGWVGTSAIAVHRLLDSGPLREAVKDNPGARYVLGVPDVLFRDVIMHAVEPPLASDFCSIVVDLPEKDFVEHGWIAVGPGADR